MDRELAEAALVASEIGCRVGRSVGLWEESPRGQLSWRHGYLEKQTGESYESQPSWTLLLVGPGCFASSCQHKVLIQTWGRDLSITSRVLFPPTSTGLAIMEGNVPLQCRAQHRLCYDLTPLMKLCFSLSCLGETRSPIVCGGPGHSSEPRQLSVSLA